MSSIDIRTTSRSPSPAPNDNPHITTTSIQQTIVPDEVLHIKQEHKLSHALTSHHQHHSPPSPLQKLPGLSEYGLEMMSDDRDQLMPINLKTSESIKNECGSYAAMQQPSPSVPYNSMEYGNSVCKIGKVFF